MIRTAKLALTVPIAGLAILVGVVLGTTAQQAQEVGHTTSAAPAPAAPQDTHW